MSRTSAPSVTSRATSVLIVDDHPIVREGLAALLSNYPEFHVCGEAGDIATALTFVGADSPDVAIVDISLQDENGLDLIRRIKARNPHVRMLVASMYDESLYAERALAAGAMGYINKQVAGRNIVSAIRQILDGRVYLSEQMTARLLTRAAGRQAPDRARADALLTNRELEVFRLIGNGLPTAGIAERLHVSIKTVETHRQKIKLKLGLSNASELSREAAHWVLQNG
jgi:DNA-binding NarL/FixJ family response regulator